jgi:predicted GNAT family acetyltransferase
VVQDGVVTTTVTDNADENRYELREEGQLAGFAEYHRYDDQLAFLHTEIDPEFGGRGLGGELIRSALDDARTRGMTVLPYCSFVRSWITRHPDYTDLVPLDQRPRFDL